MYFQKISTILLSFLVISISACEQPRTSGKGLHLPDGNIIDGQVAFADLGCNQCHFIDGVEFSPTELQTALVSIQLGGEIRFVKTYGELITSIVNPEHVLSQEYIRQLGELAKQDDVKSIMPVFNDEMTVTQLIDLLSFLNNHYKKLAPEYAEYSHAF
ncbi:MAG: hypothetical protein GKR93_10810 [Gammaproteobacteria bacterium]|nr:hypothetical protein [Gammaproteobacteria bacterium]